LAVKHLMLLLLEHGAVCRRMWHRHQHCPLFVIDWKHICFANLILTLFLNFVILSSPHSGLEVPLLLRPLKNLWLIDLFILLYTSSRILQTQYRRVSFETFAIDPNSTRHDDPLSKFIMLKCNPTNLLLKYEVLTLSSKEILCYSLCHWYCPNCMP